MFKRFLTWVQGVISKMLNHTSDVKSALKIISSMV